VQRGDADPVQIVATSVLSARIGASSTETTTYLVRLFGVAWAWLLAD
jgi:hypothetical protein